MENHRRRYRYSWHREERGGSLEGGADIPPSVARASLSPNGSAKFERTGGETHMVDTAIVVAGMAAMVRLHGGWIVQRFGFRNSIWRLGMS